MLYIPIATFSNKSTLYLFRFILPTLITFLKQV